jgi:DNA polymerase III subunit delta
VAEAAPTIYLLHGDDELAISEALAKILGKFKDPATADLNTTHLDGRSASLDELATVASALPFMAARRLVIFENPLARLQGSGMHKRFTDILDSIPPTTAVVLIEHTSLLDYRGQWLNETRWIGKWLEKTGQRTFMRTFPLPKGGAMVHWIIERTASLGGSMHPQAASALAGLVGDNTRLADQEITKLLDYVNYARPIEIEDVQLLTPDEAQVDDFALVNALRERNASKAQAILHRKLEVEDPMMILGSMIYQFRSLLLAREIIDEGGSEQDAVNQLASFKINPFPAKLAYENAYRFTPQALQDIYHRLLDIDESIKTGMMSADLALDLFTVQVTS